MRRLMINSQILGTALAYLLQTVHSTPVATLGCVTGIAYPQNDPECLPLKAEDVDSNLPPKFLFSTGYCATFASYFASIAGVLASHTCPLTSYSLPDFVNVINTSPAPVGCLDWYTAIGGSRSGSQCNVDLRLIEQWAAVLERFVAVRRHCVQLWVMVRIGLRFDIRLKVLKPVHIYRTIMNYEDIIIDTKCISMNSR